MRFMQSAGRLRAGRGRSSEVCLLACRKECRRKDPLAIPRPQPWAWSQSAMRALPSPLPRTMPHSGARPTISNNVNETHRKVRWFSDHARACSKDTTDTKCHPSLLMHDPAKGSLINRQIDSCIKWLYKVFEHVHKLDLAFHLSRQTGYAYIVYSPTSAYNSQLCRAHHGERDKTARTGDRAGSRDPLLQLWDKLRRSRKELGIEMHLQSMVSSPSPQWRLSQSSLSGLVQNQHRFNDSVCVDDVTR
eukprot:751030-Hanusia_phi.AAC.2